MRKMSGLAAVFLSVGTFACGCRGAEGREGDGAPATFRNPPAEARTRMFWRVFGPAWVPSEIDYQLNLAKAAGGGGVTAFFMYPVALDDPQKGIHNERFLSPAFLESLAYAAWRAKELGIHFSIAGGTGWPFGGPSVTIQDAPQSNQLPPVLLEP
jgi:hypothetical protein